MLAIPQVSAQLKDIHQAARFIMSCNDPTADVSRLKLDTPTIECYLGKISELRGCAALTTHEQIHILRVIFSMQRDELNSGSIANEAVEVVALVGRTGIPAYTA